MNKGFYVRCPLEVEIADEHFPRCFILAQVKEYNKLADTVEVVIHDLYNSKHYYPHAFTKTVFSADKIERCHAMTGGFFKCKYGEGHIVSRIINSTDEEAYSYYVQLENGRYLKLDETEMQIEYSQMDYSPLKQMINYEFQNPSWYSNRIKVSRNMHMINNATYGFKVLAGCRTFLLPHQISTISRCFEFSPIRYMLGDEVGLGKTIEACGIIKIMMSENSDLRALFIIPGALVNQWKNELKYKFNLLIDENSQQNRIVALEDLKFSSAQKEEWDIVIVDETHRLLNLPLEYNITLKLSKRVPNILLLSATPIQDRKEEYLHLLTLLSPEQYENMPLDQFAGLIKKQKSIQRNVNQQLKRMEKFDQYGPAIVDKLKEIGEGLGDPALKRILGKINLSSEDGGEEVTGQALSYICENYRLERRVIRNRRELLSADMAKRTLREISYVPASADDMYNETATIESVLSYLSNNSDGTKNFILSVAEPLLSALFSSPWALCEKLIELNIADAYVKSCAETWAKQALHEFNNLKELMDDPYLIKGRLLRVLDYIEQNTNICDDPDCKIVVFTAHNATLQKFYELINERFTTFGISAVAFGNHMTRKELEDSVYDFQNNENCRVIVCDEMGGEGRNFQNAELIIHIDLPWNANAVEQRIGRLDRLGRPKDMDVLSVVVYSENTIEEQLFKIWKDGMKLFERSLSGLEIITAELNQLIVDALLDDFYNGLTNAFDDILASTEKMRESVLDEQLFDVGATIYRPLNQAILNTLSAYEGEEDNLFASSMFGWANQAGLMGDKLGKTGLFEFSESKFSTRAALQSLFIPPLWKQYEGSTVMRRENRILGTFDRGLAIKREDILFFAPGDTVYDSIIRNAIGCSRGRCCAISINGLFDYTGLVFTYNVEPKLDELIDNNLNAQIISQFRIFLPLEQLVVFVPLTQNSTEVPERELKNILAESWKIRSATHLGQRGDNSVATSSLKRFINNHPLDEWSNLVKSSERWAREKAKTMFTELSDLETAKREIQRIINGYMAECIYFGKDEAIIEEKRTAYKLAYGALTRSRLVLDSACFLKVVKN